VLILLRTLYTVEWSAKINIYGGQLGGDFMYGHDRVYKKVEIIGVSKTSIEDAIQRGVESAHKSLEKLSWFEVGDIRGHVGDDGRITEYQVVMKVAFQLKEK
jgi:flavin-binding protein dodecin